MYVAPEPVRDEASPPFVELVGAAPPEPEPDADQAGASDAAESEDESEDEAAPGDYYAVLGVHERASEPQIRQAFRRQAMRWHPDHFTTAASERRTYAERRMRAILVAHATLADPLRRHAYDRGRAERAADDGMRRSPGDHAAPDYFAYSRAAVHDNQPAVGGNQNPAGMLFGTLCVVLAVAIGGRLLGGTDGGPGTLLLVVLLLGLALLAALFFSDDSMLARAAQRYMEGEPRPERLERTLRKRAARSAGTARAGAPGVQPEWGAHMSPPAFQQGSEPELTAFEALVDESLATVPEEFQQYLRNVVVRVKAEPSPNELRQMRLRPCSLLLGLYEGVPLIHQGIHGTSPEVVTIFQRPIEAYCHNDPQRIRQQVRATVLHELAHHFGMDHDAMPAWLK
ncbi:MAG: metallopeptidase family protein [Ktedonobacterales bacterium]